MCCVVIEYIRSCVCVCVCACVCARVVYRVLQSFGDDDAFVLLFVSLMLLLSVDLFLVVVFL